MVESVGPCGSVVPRRHSPCCLIGSDAELASNLTWRGVGPAYIISSAHTLYPYKLQLLSGVWVIF